MIRRRTVLLAAVTAAAGGALALDRWRARAQAPAEAVIVPSRTAGDLRVTPVARGLVQPWGLAFLPDGALLVTEKPGRLRIVQRDGRVSAPLTGLPEIPEVGQGGLMDVALHPDFARNRRLYLTAPARVPGGGYITSILTARLPQGTAELLEVETIFTGVGATGEGQHFGGRLVFDRQGLLYLTIGDRGQRDTVQTLTNHLGKVLRLTEDGRPAPDNPFLTRQDALPEIFTWGHRNPQGMAMHPETAEIWVGEHGPRGGDEINRLVAGTNYGWPLATHGEEYFGGRFAPTRLEGYADPLHVYVPSIAPSGLSFYWADRFAGWQGSVLQGALVLRHLNRVKLDGTRVVEEERLLEDLGLRIRDVRVDEAGELWLLTDARDGAVLHLAPA